MKKIYPSIANILVMLPMTILIASMIAFIVFRDLTIIIVFVSVVTVVMYPITLNNFTITCKSDHILFSNSYLRKRKKLYFSDINCYTRDNSRSGQKFVYFKTIDKEVALVSSLYSKKDISILLKLIDQKTANQNNKTQI